MVGTKVAFRGVLELTYADGSKAYLGSNTSDWKAGIAGPVKHAAIFDGEEYDARELPGYDTLDKLSTPERIRNLRERYFLQMEVRSIFVKIWRFLLKRPIYGKGSPERVKMLMERLL